MPQTITEKILAKHCGKKEVHPGELIECDVDLVLGNDITAPPAIKQFNLIGVDKVFDPDKIYLVPDHFTPEKDRKSAEQVQMMREFAKKYKITHFFEIGCVGVEHALLPEMGAIKPGDLIIGADSHTCTYGALGAFSTGVGSTDMAAAMATGKVWLKVPEAIKFVMNGKLNKWVEAKDLILYVIGLIGVDGARYMTMEFTGDTISNLSVEGKLTMANMAIEAGGKNGIFEADGWKSDKDAHYAKVIEIDCSKIEPQIAFPHLPSNTRGVSKSTDVKIDQSVIGSCTNGRIEDLRVAANVLKGRKVHKDVRLVILPATQKIYKQAMKEGLFEIFMAAGGVITTPSCGPCLGGHLGILAEGERAIATTNRNFVGRMGHPKSEVYLSNVAIAAASAILGRIGSPEEL
ncbi:3-isopropylmalate dehydratase large subunit [candidate division WOR-1 bacterium RIFOXYA12_FULL_43_27]|uniref:3-isopropylmalate dehydratase large subunit n=1 Tax=candidate division WOR-1 bacterium RIFOXYC2_FULL_46_14 TaxID=1802587 RepID=A0A1F4U771_UNCSA|nr:MAG: 3-isopropylmalate dehydratase large subunit [candidate division WOR-1 bacterium RIFOXYA12_FULL_43_27]OGC19139.1 MAG: 3-isopropylmalate dehydratase large subunit [candidate division WOR-1 bacterium RIFOXYB2_FULL_46_45]OGC30127.1 MAG: 3-isopropylmalate dehydratase large subunit [candidate division WOR-1 bacterium RIFOXYA2_FULL_46_56]OGC40729.1 MAG: 3-isopropylmalate dehydratase large subunit [candidate division WOR-1 bacterium RIFOXYC2_FULL_46_14]